MESNQLVVSNNDSAQWKKLVSAFDKCLDNIIKKSDIKKMKIICSSKNTKQFLEEILPQFNKKLSTLSKDQFAKLCNETSLREKLNNITKLIESNPNSETNLISEEWKNNDPEKLKNKLIYTIKERRLEDLQNTLNDLEKKNDLLLSQITNLEDEKSKILNNHHQHTSNIRNASFTCKDWQSKSKDLINWIQNEKDL